MSTNKSKMKVSTIILSLVLALIVAGVFASNIILKSEYDKQDKNDPYWDFTVLLKQPFSHVEINGSDLTKVGFTPSNTSSLRVDSHWDKAQRDSLLHAHVQNDTLFLDFNRSLQNRTDGQWLKHSTSIRIFAPKLISLEGKNVNLLMEDLKQKNIAINLSGKSKLEVESFEPHFDNIDVTQRDSSIVEFEMSPEWKGTKTMTFENVKANLKGPSALSLIYGDVKKFDLNIADESAIGVSGKSLRKLDK